MAAPSWAVYHGGSATQGVTTAGPDGRHPPTPLWTAHVNGQVYAEPVSADGLVVVATESDVVTALDAGTGAVRWSRTLGSPIASSTLPCGDISPVTGITGTPAIDAAAGLVRVVAFTGPKPKHELVTLDLATGAVRQRVTVDPPGLSPDVEQQRPAVVLANGRAYVAFGGLYGDCGAYKGAVVSVSDTDSTVQSWITSASREAAVWGVSGPTVAADGSLFVATGNGGTGSTFDGGDAVVHLSPALAELDAFAPSDFQQLAADDLDLGSTSPALIGGGILQVGKSGVAYLLDPAHLGGVGGQRASTSVCVGVLGAVAAGGGVAYLPCRNGVAAVAVTPTAMHRTWIGPTFNPGSPVLAGGAVWVADITSGDLVALDPATGVQRSRVHAGPLAHFATPGLAAGHLVIATLDGKVIAY